MYVYTHSGVLCSVIPLHRELCSTDDATLRGIFSSYFVYFVKFHPEIIRNLNALSILNTLDYIISE